jgi:hypothetical protein
MGQDKYNDMIVLLMNQMPGMEDIPVAAASANEKSPNSGVLLLLGE